MVIFNLFAVLNLLLSLGLCWLASLFLSDFGALESIKLGGVGVANLTLAICFFGVSALTELVGLRGRLFFLPTYAFGGLYLGHQLSFRIGVWGWVVAAVLGGAVLVLSLIRGAGNDAQKEQENPAADPSP